MAKPRADSGLGRLVLSTLASALFLVLMPFAQAQTYELLVRVERWEGTRTGDRWTSVTSVRPVPQVTLGSSSGYDSAYINLYARITNPPRGVNRERIFQGALGFRLSGDAFTGAGIAAMIGSICRAPPGGVFCATVANNMPGGQLPGSGFLPDRTAGSSTPNSLHALFLDLSTEPGVRCDAVPGGPANVCEAFLTGVPIAGLAALAAAESGVGLLTVTPSGGESVAGADQTSYSYVSPPELALRPQVVELCAPPGCVPRAAFSEATLTVAEGAGQALVTLVMDSVPETAGAVTISVTEGANADSGDYTIDPSALTQAIAAGVGEVVLTVGIEDDTEAEGGAQTLTLALSGASGGVGIGLPQSVVLEITDNDVKDVSVSFGAASYSGAEGGAVATVTVTVVNADPADTTTGPQRQVTVPVTRALRRGATDADYSGLPSAVTLAGDQAEATFEVTVVEDSERDPGEELVLGFGALPGNLFAGPLATATVSLADNDTDDWVAIDVGGPSGGPVTVLEPGIAVAATVTAGLFLGRAVAAPTEVEVALSLPAGDVAAVGALGTATISLGAGDSAGSATRTVTVRALDDSVVEAPKAVPLGGTASGGPPGIVVAPGAITVRDLVRGDVDDGNPLAGGATASDIDTATVSIGSAVAIEEGATVTLTATLDRAVDVEIRVPWSVGPNAADVVEAAGTVVFPARDTGREVPVTVVDDSLDEGVEAVKITLGTPQSALGGRVVADLTPGTVRINASDTLPESVEVTLRIERVDGLSFGGGGFFPTLTTALPARLTLGADRNTPTSRIRINTYARITNPVDGVANPDVDRAGGRRVASVKGGIALSGGGHTPAEIDAMAVAVCAPRGGGRADGCESLVEHRRLPVFGFVALAPQRGLADGMEGGFVHLAGGEVASEGPPGARCVTFPGAAANECEAFLYGFELGGLLELDSGTYGGLLRFVPRSFPGEAFTVDDVRETDPSVRVSGLVVDLCDSACVSRVAFGEAALSVGEGGRALVTLAVDPAPAAAGAVTVTETRGAGLAASDYILSATTVNVAAGAGGVVLTVDIVDDTAVEGTETLTLGLSGLTGGLGLGARRSVVLEIADNDFNDVSIAFGAASYSGAEGGAVATVTVTVANADPAATTSGPQREVVVPVTRVLRGGATDNDYGGLPSAVTLAADQVEATFEVTVVDDPDRDPGEELALGFGTLPRNVVAGAPATATVALADNDTDGWVAIAAGDSTGNPVTVLEPGIGVAATVTADLFLGAAVAAATEVEVAFSLPPGDVGAVAPLGTVTISLGTGDSAGSATGTITVRAVADSVVDAPTAVPLGGAASGGPPGIVVVPGAITVRDLVRRDIDDSNPLAGAATASDIDTATVSIGSAAAADEGATVTLTATLDRAVNVEVRVPWSARSNVGDVARATGTVVFPALDTEREVLVTIVDDRLDEGAETVEITLGTPRPRLGGRIVAAAGAGTVSINAGDHVQESIEVTVRLERVDGVGSGSAFTPTLTTALPARLTLGTDRGASSSRFRINTYARITDPVGGVANPDVDRIGGRRIAFVHGGIALSGGDYTADQINAMAVAVCAPGGGARAGACGNLAQHPRLPPVDGMSLVPWTGLADGMAGSFLHFLSGDITEGLPGVRCETFPGAAANECEAFLYGFDLGDLLALDPGAYGGLLRFEPRWLPGEAFTVDSLRGFGPLFRVSGLAVELCAATAGCLPRVAFSDAAVTVAEDAGQALVTLVVDPVAGAAGTVTVSVTEGANADPGDYAVAPAALTQAIAAGTGEVVLAVDIADDAEAEGAQTLTLEMTGADGGVGLGTQQSVVLEITDNDFNDVSISFGAASYSGTEGGAVATVTVTVANADPAATTTGPQRQVTIPITRVLRGGATDADHGGLPSAVTLAADQVEATFEVAVVDDTDEDPDEGLVLGFGALPRNVLAGAQVTTSVALVDNDTDRVVIGVSGPSGGPVTVLEPGTDVVATVTAALSLGGAVAAAGGVSVALSLPGGDIEAVGALPTVVIPLDAGDNEGTATGTVTLRALADNVVEAAKVVHLGGAASDPGIAVAPGAIIVRDLLRQDIDGGNPLAAGFAASDIDSAAVSIADGAGVAESGVATLTVSIDTVVDVPVTVSWLVVANSGFTADEVAAAAGGVVFPALGATQGLVVTLADDLVNEGVEALEVSLAHAVAEGVGDRVALDSSASSGTVEVTDDDDLAIGLRGDETVRKGGVATYTVEFAGGVSASEDVTVTLGHTGVDADGGGGGVAAVAGSAGDYAVLDPATGAPLGIPGSDATLVVPAGALGGVVSVTVHDTERAGTADRFFSVALGAFSGAAGAGAIGDPSEVTTTIRAAGGGTATTVDRSTVRLLAVGSEASPVAEAGAAASAGIVAFLSPAVSLDRVVHVTLTVSGDSTADTSDYGLALPTLTLRDRGGSAVGLFNLDPTDDEIVEGDETVVVGGRARHGAEDLTVGVVTMVITDDDTATVSVGGPVTDVAEPGAGESASAEFSVTLDGMADRDVTVTLATEAGSAAAGEDFVGRAGGAADTVVFAAGTSGPEMFTVDLSGDGLREGDETFGVTVVAVSPDYGGAVSFLGAAASATIRDEDLAAAELTVGLSLVGSHTARAAEQDSTVPLRLTAHLGRSDGVGSASPLDDDLVVTLTVSAASTADAGDYYGIVLPTVTITAGETSAPADLRFELRDNEIVEGRERIVIGGDTGTSLVFHPMTVVLIDEDKAAVTINAPAEAVAEPAAGESAAAVFSVALGKAADRDVTVTLATAGDGAATAGDDFIGRTGTVVFTAGDTGPLPFAVDLVADDEFERDEAFGLTVAAIAPDYGGAIFFPGPAVYATIAAPAVSLTATVGSGVGNEISLSWESLDIPGPPEPPESPDTPGSPEPPTTPGVESPPEGAPPPLTYELQYKKADEDVWIPVEHTGTVTTAMLTGLEGGAVYDVRIRPNSAGTQGRWAVTQVLTPAANFRVLPRVAGPGNAGVSLNGDDALLVFYFTQFNDVLSRPANRRLSRIVVRGLSRGRPLSDADADGIIAAASALGSGAIPASHPANLYDADPFENHDALLLFYSIQFGDILARPELGRLMEIVVNGVLPRGHGLSPERMRALIQAGRDLARTL